MHSIFFHSSTLSKQHLPGLHKSWAHIQLLRSSYTVRVNLGTKCHSTHQAWFRLLSSPLASSPNDFNTASMKRMKLPTASDWRAHEGSVVWAMIRWRMDVRDEIVHCMHRHMCFIIPPPRTYTHELVAEALKNKTKSSQRAISGLSYSHKYVSL